MAGEESEAEDDLAAGVPPSVAAGVKLADAPILFFVVSHKAFRKELVELRRIVVEAAESGSHHREVVDDLCRRFEFLKLVYKYHTAAEDELIFQALDVKVRNVVSTYALEHNCIDDDFNSLFHCLNLLKQESEDIPNLFLKLIFSISTVDAFISRHMLKEEEQVFPLLQQEFSLEEQAKLVWKYICSIPVVLVEDFLPWMASSLPPDEKIDLLCCLKVIVPKEELLQEVIISWLENNKQSSPGSCNMSGKGAQFCGGQTSFKEILKIYGGSGTLPFEEEKPLKEAYLIHKGRQNPVDGIHIWNVAIERGFRKVLEELYQIRSSNNISNLSSVVIQLQFFSDILIFYSNVLDRIFYPTINELSENGLSYSRKLVDESQIPRLQHLLHGKPQTGIHLSNFLEMLSSEVEFLLRGFRNIQDFLETEVFPFISKNCNHEMQLLLLYAGLQTMPLGLLKCTVLWFSSTLSEEHFKSILGGMKVESPVLNKCFYSLLREWVRMGHLGKTSIEKFTKDLQENFSIGSHCLYEQVRTNNEFSNLKLEVQAINNFSTRETEANCPLSINSTVCHLSSCLSNTTENLELSCSDKMNVHAFCPGIWRDAFSVHKGLPMHERGNNSFTFESRPMDQIFFVHKALIKHLDSIVFLSARLVESVQLFPDFQRSLERLQFLYDSHSDTEDKIIFPFLESKGKLKNITLSYSIDHKVEAEHFKKISAILNDICRVHGDPDRLIHGGISYDQLCLQLHEACLSMHKIVTEHINLEEVQLGPLFRENFSNEEQEKIIGDMLGRTTAETLLEIIHWLMSSLTQDEQHSVISLWRKVTRNTNFDEWLGEWWEDMKSNDVAEDKKGSSSVPSAADPLEVVSMYLRKDNADIEGSWQDKGISLAEKSVADHNLEKSRSLSLKETQDHEDCQNLKQYKGLANLSKEPSEINCREDGDCIDQADETMQHENFCQEEHPLVLSQKELEVAIRKVSRDSTLDTQKKSHVIQSLLMSRWIVSQRSVMSAVTTDKEEDMGQCPSYQDSLKLVYGCKHYKRYCKLLSPCCNKLYTCIRCHDEFSDHSVDRKAITKMMCMKCLIIQPVGRKCSNFDCNSFSMARYYCRICKLFDDERQIYHCPYCNLCRVGKGLGIDYFHCMHCNACMSRSLAVHICREKCFEDNCPICHEYIFTSNSPVKALPCGHLMHSACFQEYTCNNYTCPICSKSLGNMQQLSTSKECHRAYQCFKMLFCPLFSSIFPRQVYFNMLDALLAEEKIPEEYSGQTQVVLCNDCESRGTASFHWLYHKCHHCGSYNTRLL